MTRGEGSSAFRSRYHSEQSGGAEPATPAGSGRLTVLQSNTGSVMWGAGRRAGGGMKRTPSLAGRGPGLA